MNECVVVMHHNQEGTVAKKAKPKKASKPKKAKKPARKAAKRTTPLAS